MAKRSTHEEQQRRLAREEILKCIGCGMSTSKVEAADRLIRTGSCGRCGGMLVSIDQCAKKLRVRGKNFLCLRETGHRGKHHYKVEVA